MRRGDLSSHQFHHIRIKICNNTRTVQQSLTLVGKDDPPLVVVDGCESCVIKGFEGEKKIQDIVNRRRSRSGEAMARR